MTEIMFDNQKTRVVLLNRSFGGDGRDMKELRVRFTEQGAIFFQLLQDQAPLNYGLSTAEADAFCAAWTAHRAERQAKVDAEQGRLQAMVTEAYAIAAQCPAIKIEQVDNATWKVFVPAIGWGHQGPLTGPKELLELTKQAWAAYTSQMAWQAANSKATA